MNPELRYIYKRLLFDFVKENKWLILLYTILILGTYPLITVGSSKLFAQLVESLGKKISFKTKPYESTYGIVIALSVLMTITSIIFFFQYYLERKLFPAFIKYVGVNLRKGALYSRSENFEKIKIGEFLSMMNKTIENLELLMYNIWNKVIPISLTVIAICIYYFYLNPKLGILMLFIEIIRFVIIIYNGSNYRNVTSDKYTNFYDISQIFANTFENSFNITINNKIKSEAEKQVKLADSYNIYVDKEMNSKSTYMTSSYIIGIVSFILKFFYSYFLFRRGKLNLDQILTITFIEGRMIQAWTELDFVLLNVFKIFGNIDSGKDIIYKCLIETDGCDSNQTVNSGQIEITNLMYKDILNIKSHTFIADSNYLIKGKSGSGKSTLVSLIMRMKQISSGTIQIGNMNLNDLCVLSLRNIIVLVPQENYLFNNVTIMDNLKYGTNLNEKSINDILEKYNFFPGKNINSFKVTDDNLSGGLRRRIIVLRGIFRALDNKCKIIILDEPFAGLDAEISYHLLKLMYEKINGNKTIIIIEHTIESGTGEVNVFNQKQYSDANLTLNFDVDTNLTFNFNVVDMNTINSVNSIN